MKRLALSAIIALGLMSVANASEVDILATLANGKVSDTSAGVKVLSLNEEKEVAGGYKVGSASWYSYTYIQMPYTNNYNANTRPQTNNQSIYSNAFMQTYKPPRFFGRGW